jgi:hypothetical protein
MTIVVTVRVNDGIVLAADSATSFSDENGTVVKVYNSANKIFNLVKGHPIGAMTYGAGSIGAASISTLSKDLRVKFMSAGNPYHLDLQNYTMQEVALKAQQFFFTECFQSANPQGLPGHFLGYRVCGYSANQPLPEAWEFNIGESDSPAPTRLYEMDSYGPRWAGETEAIDRLVLGLGSKATDALTQMGLEQPQALQLTTDLMGRLYAHLYHPAMPVQDAIDLAQFLADTAARFTQMSLRAPTIGGPIEVATITKHEGFKWVSRKHYFSAEFNRG